MNLKLKSKVQSYVVPIMAVALGLIYASCGSEDNKSETPATPAPQGTLAADPKAVPTGTIVPVNPSPTPDVHASPTPVASVTPIPISTPDIVIPEPSPTVGGSEPVVVTPSPTIPPEVRLSYGDVKDILDSQCVICHHNDVGGISPDLSTLPDVIERRPRLIARVGNGTMPRFQPTWKDSDDGKKLLKWLTEGAEFNP